MGMSVYFAFACSTFTIQYRGDLNAKKIEYVVESFIFNSRWLLAPFFIGLIICIGILLVKFSQELAHLFPTLLSTSDSTIIVSVLTLVDITLVASL